MASINKLAQLLNKDQEDAKEAAERFRQMLEEEIADVGEDEFRNMIDEELLGYNLAAFIDEAQIGNTFMVDWKDTESAIDWLEGTLEDEGIDLTLQYGVTDPIDELNAQQIFVRANQQLKAVGYSLLDFETGEDCFREILLPSKSVGIFLQIMQEINVGIDLNDTEYNTF